MCLINTTVNAPTNNANGIPSKIEWGEPEKSTCPSGVIPIEVLK